MKKKKKKPPQCAFALGHNLLPPDMMFFSLPLSPVTLFSKGEKKTSYLGEANHARALSRDSRLRPQCTTSMRYSSFSCDFQLCTVLLLVSAFLISLSRPFHRFIFSEVELQRGPFYIFESAFGGLFIEIFQIMNDILGFLASVFGSVVPSAPPYPQTIERIRVSIVFDSMGYDWYVYVFE